MFINAQVINGKEFHVKVDATAQMQLKISSVRIIFLEKENVLYSAMPNCIE